ncbi:MAG: hypothetical protein ACI4S9_01305 [Christensenellales bacterium]
MAKKITVLFLIVLMAFSASACSDSPANSSLDLSLKSNFEKKSFAANSVEDGIYTTYQIAGTYNSTTAVPTDSVMAYAATISGVEGLISSYLDKGYKQVDMMIPNGRDMGCYFINGHYDGKEHYDIVQRDNNGTYHLHTEGSYYVHPSEEFNEYLAEWCKRGIAAGAKDIYIEEPDGYINYCYSDYFKKLWREKYGEDYVYDEESLDQITKRNAIVAQMFVDSYDYVARSVKETYPDSKVYIATHSATSYSSVIVANNGAIVALESIDGVIGQSWTNTSMQPIYYDGGKNVRCFENSYTEYSELVNLTVGLDGKKAYMLNDAKADGGYSYETCRPIWEDTIVAQMLMPDVYCFESTVWAERAFTNAPETYKGVQEAIYRLQGEIHSFESTTYSGTNGVGVVASFTGADSFLGASDNLSALVTPLVRSGIPVDVITLERLTSAETLKNIDILILSYDCIKPNSTTYSKVIAEWVKGGGTLIYVGGYNYAQNFEGSWTEEGYVTPQDQLFDNLGLSVTGFDRYTGAKTVTSTKNCPEYLTGTDAFATLGNTFTSYSIGKEATELLKIGNDTLAFEQKIGSGNVVIVGVEPKGLSAFEGSYSELYEKILMRAVDLAGKQYYAPGAMYTVRGSYEFYRTFDRTMTLSGTFIDMFSDNFDVVVNPTIEKETSKCYKRVSGESGILYGSGAYVVERETETGITFRASNVALSRGILVFGSGSGIKSVTAEYVKSGTEPSDFGYEYENGFLTISYRQNKDDEVRITVSYE